MRPDGIVFTPDPVDWDHPLNQGRVLWLYGLPPLDGGRQWFDLAGQNHGTLTNGPTWAPTGRGDSGVAFDATNDAVVCGPGPDVTSVTLAAWAKMTAPPASAAFQHEVVTRRAAAGNVPWAMDVQGTSALVRFYLNNGGFSVYAASVGIASGVWVRLLAAYTPGAIPQIYFNGVAQSVSRTVGSSDPAIPTSTNNVVVGSYTGISLNDFPFNGSLSDVSVWSRDLSAAEARQDYDLSRRNYPGVLRRVSPSAWVVGGAGVSYTLAVTAAAVTITPSAVTPRVGRVLPVTPAAVTLTPTAVSLRVGRTLAVAPAAVTLTPAAVGLAAARRLSVSPAAVTLTGSAVGLRADRRLTVSAAAVNLAPSDVGLAYSGAAKVLAVGPAAVTLTPSAVGLRVSRRLAVDPAVLLLTPSAVGLNYSGAGDKTLTVQGASLLLTPSAVGLRVARRLAVDPAALLLTPGSVGLTYSGAALPLPKAVFDVPPVARRFNVPRITRTYGEGSP